MERTKAGAQLNQASARSALPESIAWQPLNGLSDSGRRVIGMTAV